MKAFFITALACFTFSVYGEQRVTTPEYTISLPSDWEAAPRSPLDDGGTFSDMYQSQQLGVDASVQFLFLNKPRISLTDYNLLKADIFSTVDSSPTHEEPLSDWNGVKIKFGFKYRAEVNQRLAWLKVGAIDNGSRSCIIIEITSLDSTDTTQLKYLSTSFRLLGDIGLQKPFNSNSQTSFNEEPGVRPENDRLIETPRFAFHLPFDWVIRPLATDPDLGLQYTYESANPKQLVRMSIIKATDSIGMTVTAAMTAVQLQNTGKGAISDTPLAFWFRVPLVRGILVIVKLKM